MTALIGAFPASKHSSVFCFSVTASAEPSVMPRLMAVFSQLGLVPDKWYSIREDHNRDGLSIDLQMSGLDAAQADHLAAAMRRIVLVDSVLLYEKPRESSRAGSMSHAG